VDYEAALSEALKVNPIAWKVVVDLVPNVAVYDHDLAYTSQVRDQRNEVDRALGVLERQEELEENWPTEPAAQLDTSQIHRWVWEPAKALWDIKRYTEGLHSAAVTVNARMQEKLGRDDLEFSQLARNGFSPEPPTPGNPRLRLVTEDEADEDTSKNFHLGAASLGDYIFRRWRNITSHNEPDMLLDQAANEALGAMSLFARMVDQASVVKVSGDQ
jgi:hypothetical protein